MNAANSKVGDILEEAFDFKEITWKIPNFLSLRGPLHFCVKSSSFIFASAIWELRVYPFGNTKTSHGYISLAIKRLSSRIPKHHVFYKYCLKTQNGEEYEIQYCDDWFTRKSYEWIYFKYLHRSKLMEIKESVVPNGILTVVCQVRTEKIASINDRSSQTEAKISFPGEYVLCILNLLTSSKLIYNTGYISLFLFHIYK